MSGFILLLRVEPKMAYRIEISSCWKKFVIRVSFVVTNLQVFPVIAK